MQLVFVCWRDTLLYNIVNCLHKKWRLPGNCCKTANQQYYADFGEGGHGMLPVYRLYLAALGRQSNVSIVDVTGWDLPKMKKIPGQSMRETVSSMSRFSITFSPGPEWSPILIDKTRFGMTTLTIIIPDPAVLVGWVATGWLDDDGGVIVQTKERRGKVSSSTLLR